jgi:hypothetical protein
MSNFLPFTASDMMNMILAHSCPTTLLDEDDAKWIYIETHCVAWNIRVKFINHDEVTDKYTYEILEFNTEPS